MSRALKNYISRYAEAETRYAAAFFSEKKLFLEKKYVIVVPCYAENIDFLLRLTTHIHADQLLAIIVINEPENDKTIVKTLFLKNNFANRQKTFRQHMLSPYGKCRPSIY